MVIENLKKFGIPIDEVYIVSDKFAFQNDYASIVQKINDIPEKLNSFWGRFVVGNRKAILLYKFWSRCAVLGGHENRRK